MNCFGRRPNAIAGFLGGAAIIVIAGCGNVDSGVYHVSGEVTFEGRPVPAGTVLFQPDASQGASGPAGLAIIRDGKYDTADAGGKGIVGGPQRVRITGLDGKPADMAPNGVPIFRDYSTTVKLPSADTTHDFAITNHRSRRN
ncbi:MAG: hypothetical protein ACIALR_13540 [Blastopirellula sp. JB062]